MSTHVEWQPYDAWLDDAVRELTDALPDADRQQLHAMLKKLTRHGWMVWLQEHAESAERYLSESPARRLKVRFGDSQERLLTLYGAIWMAQLGGSMGHWFHHPALSPDWGDRRDTQATRGRVVWECWFAAPEEWPFDEPPGLGSPFDE